MTPRYLPPATDPRASARAKYAATVREQTADEEIERMGEQLVELLERARVSEERAAYAEQQLVHMEQQLTHMTRMANAAAEAAVAIPARNLSLEIDEPPRRKGSSGNFLAWTAVALVLALAVAGYVFGYVPLRSEFQALVKQNLEQSAQHSQELARREARFAEERKRFESQLAAAQAAATPPPAATGGEPAAAPTSRRAAKAADSEVEDESDAEARAAKAEQRKAEREAKRAEREAKRAERAAARAAKQEDESEESEDEPAKAAKPEADMGDDPLGGLDGL